MKLVKQTLFFALFSIILLTYLFGAVMSLRCSVGFFSSCSKQGYSLVEVCRFLITVAFVVSEQGAQALGSTPLGSSASREHGL